MWQRSHLKRETLCAGVMAALRSINTKKYEEFRRHASIESGSHVKGKSSKSTSNTEHGQRKIIAIMDATMACFHTNMDELIHAHTPRETVSDLGCEF